MSWIQRLLMVHRFSHRYESYHDGRSSKFRSTKKHRLCFRIEVVILLNACTAWCFIYGGNLELHVFVNIHCAITFRVCRCIKQSQTLYVFVSSCSWYIETTTTGLGRSHSRLTKRKVDEEYLKQWKNDVTRISREWGALILWVVRLRFDK